MAKYQRLMDEIQQQIEAGIWLPGTRLPSLRQQVAQQGVSLMTVLHAYELLESQGWIVSRPQSGYYVAPRALAPAPLSVAISEQVDINDFVFDVLQATRDPAIVPFGSAFPDPALFPQRQLMRSLANVSHHLTQPMRCTICRPATPGCDSCWRSAMRVRASPCRRMKLSSPAGRWRR